MKLNRTGANWYRLERNKINENWDIIEGSYNDVVGQITDEVVGHLIDSSRLDWKVPVDSFSDMPNNPEVGETRSVRDTGYVYRFNGDVWIRIYELDMSLINEIDRRLTRQLAETDQHRRFESPINRRNTSKRLMINHTDDDGNVGVYNILRQYAKEYNIMFTSALITGSAMSFPGDNRPQNERMLSYSQIMEMHQEGTVEFVSHTKTHVNLNESSNEVVFKELFESREFIKRYGFNHRFIVFPFGAISQRVIDIAKRIYDYASMWGGTNKIMEPPFDSYRIPRVPLNQPIENLKAKIDEAAEKGLPLIVRSHIDQDGYGDEHYREYIEYALSKGFEFVGLEEMMNEFGNLMELDNDNIIDFNGNIHSNSIGRFVIDNSVDIDADTPLQYFKPNTTTLSIIRFAQKDEFPTDDEGILQTVRLTKNEGLWNYQLFTPLKGDRYTSYLRYWDRDELEWTEWSTSGITGFLGLNAVSVNDKPTKDILSRRITYTYINSFESGNFPSGKTGYLITNALILTDATYQEYHIKNDSLVYKRHWNPSGDKWGDWFVSNSNFPTIYKEMNEISPSAKVGDFEVGITIGRTTSSHSFITGKGGGFVKTTRFAGTEYFSAEQEFKENDTSGVNVNKYVRYGKSDGNWTSWRRYVLEDI